MVHIPCIRNWMRFVPVAYGIALFIWMSLEDNSSLAVSVLGALFALLVALAYILNHFGGQTLVLRIGLPTAALFGLVTGAGAVLASALLMLLKNGWHAHLYPDFPPLMIRDMLLRLPSWALAGSLLGIALALLRVSYHPQSNSAPSGKI